MTGDTWNKYIKFFLLFLLHIKNPAYRRHWISRPMRIVSPWPWREDRKLWGDLIFFDKICFWRGPKKIVLGVWYVTKTEISPNLKCHQNWSFTKTEMLLKLKCYHTLYFCSQIKIKIPEIGTEYLGLVEDVTELEYPQGFWYSQFLKTLLNSGKWKCHKNWKIT